MKNNKVQIRKAVQNTKEIFTLYITCFEIITNRFANRIFAHQNIINSQGKYKIGLAFV